jgi:hypothetical protein
MSVVGLKTAIVPTEYMAPGDSQLQEFAEAVCADLSAKKNNADMNSRESVSGLANFLKVLTRIQAKAMTRGVWLDDNHE